jgi:hypothetical protein
MENRTPCRPAVSITLCEKNPSPPAQTILGGAGLPERGDARGEQAGRSSPAAGAAQPGVLHLPGLGQGGQLRVVAADLGKAEGCVLLAHAVG